MNQVFIINHLTNFFTFALEEILPYLDYSIFMKKYWDKDTEELMSSGFGELLTLTTST